MQQERVLETVAQYARTYGVVTILGMGRLTEKGRQIVAPVIDAEEASCASRSWPVAISS